MEALGSCWAGALQLCELVQRFVRAGDTFDEVVGYG